MTTWKDVENITPEKFSYLTRNERIEYLRKMQSIFQSRLKQFSRKDAPYSFSLGQFITYRRTRGKEGLNYKKYIQDPSSYTFAQLSHVYASLYNSVAKESGSIKGANTQMKRIAEKQFGMDYTKESRLRMAAYFRTIDMFREHYPVEYETRNYYHIAYVAKIITDTGRTIDSFELSNMQKTLAYYDYVEKKGVTLKEVYDAIYSGEWPNLYKRVTGMDWYEPV